MTKIERADAFVMWSWAECTSEARRGHAYVFAGRTQTRWLSFEHGPERTPRLLAQLERWEAVNPPPSGRVRRDRAWWKQPDGRWSFTGDLGLVGRLLAGRELIVRQGDDAEPLPALPDGFLRRPIATMVEAIIGPVSWPRTLDAEHVRVGPAGLRAARTDETMVVCAARYGSLHEDAGQDRTAAIWCSYDDGASWIELGWALDPVLLASPAGQHCWPPEQILAVRIVDGEPVIEWDDPWIDWEPGDEWRAFWRPRSRDWWMEVR